MWRPKYSVSTQQEYHSITTGLNRHSHIARGSKQPSTPFRWHPSIDIHPQKSTRFSGWAKSNYSRLSAICCLLLLQKGHIRVATVGDHTQLEKLSSVVSTIGTIPVTSKKLTVLDRLCDFTNALLYIVDWNQCEDLKTVSNRCNHIARAQSRVQGHFDGTVSMVVRSSIILWSLLDFLWWPACGEKCGLGKQFCA